MKNRGELYADGFFESIILNHRSKLWPLHFQRIVKTAEFLYIHLPHNFSSYTLFKKLLEGLSLKNPESNCVRINFVREGGGLYLPESNEALVDFQPKYVNNIWNESKILKTNVGILDSFKIYSKGLNQWKTLAKVSNVLYSINAKTMGFDDVILLNENDNLVELISSNIFFMKEGMYFTPSIEDGCLNGVFRQFLLNEFTNKGLKYFETSISKDDISQFDGCFSTNAVQGIMPISNIGAKVFDPKCILLFLEKYSKKLIFE